MRAPFPCLSFFPYDNCLSRRYCLSAGAAAAAAAAVVITVHVNMTHKPSNPTILYVQPRGMGLKQRKQHQQINCH
jgi:hypothetical protein